MEKVEEKKGYVTGGRGGEGGGASVTYKSETTE
jgi:hypothetical protein